MRESGRGHFFDGRVSTRRPVGVTLDSGAVTVRGDDQKVLARWPYDELVHLSAPADTLRVGRRGNPTLERLEIKDPHFAAALDELATTVDRSGASEARVRRRMAGWALAACASLVVVAVYGVPGVANRLAPFVPQAAEQRLGEAVDAQVRNMLDTGNRGDAFVCRGGADDAEARAALTQLVAKLESAAALPIPLKVAVVRRSDPNAIALPGGFVYIFEGLIDRAESADEVAAVVAHEIGHVAHRDGTRSILQAAGLSFLFGMVLGDFVGGGAVVLASQAVLRSAYSRDVETAADMYAIDLMTKIGADARALATMLAKLGGGRSRDKSDVRILLSHPEMQGRVAAIEAKAPPGGGQPVLDAAGFAALRRLCARPS